MTILATYNIRFIILKVDIIFSHMGLLQKKILLKWWILFRMSIRCHCSPPITSFFLQCIASNNILHFHCCLKVQSEQIYLLCKLQLALDFFIKLNWLYKHKATDNIEQSTTSLPSLTRSEILSPSDDISISSNSNYSMLASGIFPFILIYVFPMFYVFFCYVFTNFCRFNIFSANMTKTWLLSIVKCKHVLEGFCLTRVKFSSSMYGSSLVWYWYIYIL